MIIDYREPEKYKKALQEIKSFKVDIGNLPYGDYLVGNFLIERKTVADFIKSIYDRRIWKQLDGMKSVSDYPILLVEGYLVTPYSTQTARDYDVFLSALVKIITSFKVPVVMLKDEAQTLDFLIKMAKLIETEQKRKPYIKFYHKKAMTDDEVLLRILTAFPKIGIKTAVKLLSKHSTLRKVFLESDNKKILKYLDKEFRGEY